MGIMIYDTPLRWIASSIGIVCIVLIMMGSGTETARETIDYLTGTGEKVGVLQIRLFRPFSGADFIAAIPDTVTAMAVLLHDGLL